MKPEILVLYNEPTLDPHHPDAESEREVLETASIVAEELRDARYNVESLGLNTDPARLVDQLRTRRPDAVFNLFEGTAQQGQTEAFAAGVLEWFGVPYTGCPFPSLVLARDKPRAKLLLQGAGLPTPPFFVAERLPIPEDALAWPVIAKLANEDASVGLDQGSVVTNQRQLNEQVASLLRRYSQSVLVEEYIDGRECNVAVIQAPELRALPISEIVFSPPTKDQWRIVTYDAKWMPGSSDDLATTPQCPAHLDADLTDRLQELAKHAFRLFGCRHYARIDFRINFQREPYILEVNPNPDYHPTVGLTRSLNVAGITHAEFTVQLVEDLLRPRL